MRKLPNRILCLVTDLERAGGQSALIHTVSEAVRGGVNMVQVREHQLSSRDLRTLATAIVGEVGDDALVIVNGPPEFALESGAHGVHFKESGSFDRTKISQGLLIGQSSHSLESAHDSELAGVDYVMLGTIFSSASHPGGTTGGPDLVRSVTGEIKKPVIGIGGITTENAAEVIVAGASGIAVIGAIIGAQNPFLATQALASAIELTN